MAALSRTLCLCLGPGLPNGLLLCFRECQSVPGPSGSQLRCGGYGEPVLFDRSASLIAALCPALGVWFI